jgi:alkylation response protein AidB-like acyl-CoA dehydrogenase
VTGLAHAIQKGDFMDFALNDTQIEIVAMAERFAQKEIAPIVEEDEANGHFRRELFTKVGAAGLLGITISPDHGGAGLGTLEYSLLLEQLARVSSGYATSISVSNLPISIIDAAGSEELKAKYMPSLISGEKIGAFALTEPTSGSDAGSLRTTAVRKGDTYVLNGVKQFITNGMHADIFAVMARTGGEGPRGVTAFIVEKEMGLKGGKFEKKMGMKVSPTQEILFDNVVIPAANRIGEEGSGFSVAKNALDGGRISIASIANGVSQAALDRALSYAKEREQFGKPILEFQGVSFLLADMATSLEASRLLTRQACWLKDQKKPFKQMASMAKLQSTESCMRITTDAVQILGGYGYIEEFTVERYMREAKMLQIVEGTSQIQRVVIAKGLVL